jgi:hypothetical protein
VTLKIAYSPLMLARAQEMLADVRAQGNGHGRTKANEEYCQRTYGLSYDYVSKIGTHYKRPSSRVLDNMGLEVWVRNPRTGQTEKLEHDYTCDWNPQRQTKKLPASPTSSSGSKSAPPE